MRAQKFLLIVVGLLMAMVGPAFAQTATATAPASATATATAVVPTPTATATPIVPDNFTSGFGNDRLVTLTYTQQFDCIDEPTDDLNFNGIEAQFDPAEFQTPICQVGTATVNSPAGFKTARNTQPLYALIPMFSTTHDTNPNNAIACDPAIPTDTLCGPALGTELISLFGIIPEAFEQVPTVAVQCPNPGTKQFPLSPPGTCTMHTARIDIGKVLVALKLSTTDTNVFVPEPNLDNLLMSVRVADLNAHWWEVMPVLVTNPNDWPTATGSSGITSFKRLEAAVAAKDATIFPSNYFLFFNSIPSKGKTQ